MAKRDNRPTPVPVRQAEWGEQPENHYGYASDAERLNKRGLEDWEMVEKIPEQQHNVPYWFVAVFVVLLVVAIGLAFPFWGDRPDQPRAWFDWGIPGGALWVISSSFAVYYIVDYRHIRAARKEAKAKALAEAHAAQLAAQDDTASSAQDRT